MNWLTSSFEENTVAWVLIASLLGGVVGASTRFVFEDVLRPRLGWRREMLRVVHRHTTPLVRSAETLERRLNNMIRNEAQDWYNTSEYYRLSTLYVFGEHLGWIRIIERQLGDVPFESSVRGRDFGRRLYGLFRALTSFAYFRWHPDPVAVGDAVVPRLMLTAIGEAMTGVRSEALRPIDFTDFVVRYADEPRFRRWFQDLDIFLASCHPSCAMQWDRLIAAGANLRALIGALDPKGAISPIRPVVNLDRIVEPQLRAEVEADLALVVPATHRTATEPVAG
jgi:hypothetical protein